MSSSEVFLGDEMRKILENVSYSSPLDVIQSPAPARQETRSPPTINAETSEADETIDLPSSGLAVTVAPDVKTEMTVPELRRNTDHHLKFRNELYAAIEELKIRRLVDKDNEEKVDQLLREKFELEARLDEALMSVRSAKEDGEMRVTEVRKSVEHKLMELTEREAMQVVVVETAQKTVRALKERIRMHKLSEYGLQKKVRDLEMTLQQQGSRTENGLKVVDELTARLDLVTKRSQQLTTIQENLQSNIVAAMEINRSQVRVNKHQECIIEAKSAELERWKEELFNERIKLDCLRREAKEKATQDQVNSNALRLRYNDLCQTKDELAKELKSKEEEQNQNLEIIKQMQALVFRSIEDEQRLSKENKELKQELRDKLEKIRQLIREVENKTEEIEKLNKELGKNSEEIWRLRLELGEQAVDVEKLNKEVRNKSDELETLKNEFTERSDWIEGLNKELRNKSDEIDKLDKSFGDMSEDVKRLNIEIADKSDEIKKLNKEVGDSAEKIHRLNIDLVDRAGCAAELKAKVDTLLSEAALRDVEKKDVSVCAKPDTHDECNQCTEINIEHVSVFVQTTSAQEEMSVIRIDGDECMETMRSEEEPGNRSSVLDDKMNRNQNEELDDRMNRDLVDDSSFEELVKEGNEKGMATETVDSGEDIQHHIFEAQQLLMRCIGDREQEKTAIIACQEHKEELEKEEKREGQENASRKKLEEDLSAEIASMRGKTTVLNGHRSCDAESVDVIETEGVISIAAGADKSEAVDLFSVSVLVAHLASSAERSTNGCDPKPASDVTDDREALEPNSSSSSIQLAKIRSDGQQLSENFLNTSAESFICSSQSRVMCILQARESNYCPSEDNRERVMNIGCEHPGGSCSGTQDGNERIDAEKEASDEINVISPVSQSRHTFSENALNIVSTNQHSKNVPPSASEIVSDPGRSVGKVCVSSASSANVVSELSCTLPRYVLKRPLNNASGAGADGCTILSPPSSVGLFLFSSYSYPRLHSGYSAMKDIRDLTVVSAGAETVTATVPAVPGPMTAGRPMVVERITVAAPTAADLTANEPMAATKPNDISTTATRPTATFPTTSAKATAAVPTTATKPPATESITISGPTRSALDVALTIVRPPSSSSTSLSSSSSSTSIVQSSIDATNEPYSLDRRFTELGQWSSGLEHRSMELDSRSSMLEQRSSLLEQRSSMSDQRSSVQRLLSSYSLAVKQSADQSAVLMGGGGDSRGWGVAWVPPTKRPLAYMDGSRQGEEAAGSENGGRKIPASFLQGNGTGNLSAPKPKKAKRASFPELILETSSNEKKC